jgi:purine-cytosine permease-like protein
MHAADIGPVASEEQTQSSFDLFLIFVGANVVATTFQVGASLSASFSMVTVAALIAIGSVAGAALVAALAPVGPRLRVPSVIAARLALGVRGAALVAVVLYVTNFAWIALNNVIAASACARLGLGASQPAWAIALGLLATVVVWRGPAAVARADRVAVPLMVIVAIALTVACLRSTATPAPIVPAMTWWSGLDVVIAYQVSWILMFSDYSRYTRSVGGSVAAVFLGLALTSLWMMPLGAVAARAAGTDDPGTMLAAVGLGRAGALLLTVATLTTNFVNIYMSSLAWKSLVPRASDASVIWSIGIIGTALGAIPGVWLEQYTNFMVLLGATLVPVGGILLAHLYLGDATVNGHTIAELYDDRGPLAGINRAGLAAWIAGAVTYFVAGSRAIRVGGTVPSLVVSIAAYQLLRAKAVDRIERRRAARR